MSELRSLMEALADQLEQSYPGMFDRENPKPLAIGVFYQVHPELSDGERRVVQPLLAWWCSRRAYLRACIVEGSQRFNLDGSVAGPVNEGQRQHAIRRLAEREKKKSAA